MVGPCPSKTYPDACTLRAVLWHKRLAREARVARAYAGAVKDRGDADPRPVSLARCLLRVAGLWERGARNANTPIVREETFVFEALPREFDGYRVLLLSDLHIDKRPGFVDAGCKVVRDIDADLCVMTGDYGFRYRTPQADVFEGLRRICDAIRVRDGTLAVLGNNDRSEAVPALRALGVRVLVNEHWTLERADARIVWAGIDDVHEFKCGDLDVALAGAPGGSFKVVLAHSPERIREAAARGADLFLCGHTHGGQIRLPVVGPLTINARCPRCYASGGWRDGTLQGYTTTGLGACGLPVRFNCPPEVVRIELRGDIGRTADGTRVIQSPR